MNVSPTLLLVTVTIGIPLMLLALGVLYHAYLLGRQPVDLAEHVSALATESVDELVLALQEAVEEMQGQLARQRQTLASMLSDGGALTPVTSHAASAHNNASYRPLAAGEFVSREEMSPAAVVDEIASLLEEGMTDREVARELRIGLDEVRMVRMRSNR